MSLLLKVAKIAITRLSLGLSPQNQQNFQGSENSWDNSISYTPYATKQLHEMQACLSLSSRIAVAQCRRHVLYLVCMWFCVLKERIVLF